MPNSHTEVYLHLVWATWDRLPLITLEIEKPLYDCIRTRCRDMHTHILAIGGNYDHVHILIRMTATKSIVEVVGDIKGASSHFVTHELNHVEFQWQGAYSAFSVDNSGLESLMNYIENQKKHHQEKTLREGWELH